MTKQDVASKAAEFIERLKEFQFRKKLAPALRSVHEGDWDAIVGIASAEGFHFTKEELKAALPKGFFKGEGKDKEKGWSRNVLNK